MKTISKREHSGKTMTVGELKEFLSKFLNEMPVVATWEGVSAGIIEENIIIKKPDNYYSEDTLEIDVECYG